MKISFLKKSKWPRVAPPMEEKTVNGSMDDQIFDHCSEELMEAVKSKDHMGFRRALEALVLNMFEDESKESM